MYIFFQLENNPNMKKRPERHRVGSLPEQKMNFSMRASLGGVDPDRVGAFPFSRCLLGFRAAWQGMIQSNTRSNITDPFAIAVSVNLRWLQGVCYL